MVVDVSDDEVMLTTHNGEAAHHTDRIDCRQSPMQLFTYKILSSLGDIISKKTQDNSALVSSFDFNIEKYFLGDLLPERMQYDGMAIARMSRDACVRTVGTNRGSQFTVPNRFAFSPPQS